MVDFGRARQHMVDNQLRTSGVFDAGVLSRMRAIPREIFVPADRRDVAYIDQIHRLAAAGDVRRFIPGPAALAKLLQLAEVRQSDTVLDVGAGTGYGTAVLAGLAASVVGLEFDGSLAETARANLGALAIGNAKIVSGDAGALGRQLFDVILFEGTVAEVPPEYLALLADGGRLVAPVLQRGVGVARVLVRSGSAVTARTEFNLALPQLFAAEKQQEFVF